MIAAIKIAVHGIEVKTDYMPTADRHVENRGPAHKVFLSPCLATDHKRLAFGVPPLHHNSTTVFRTIQTGGAISHAHPVARGVVKRKILAENVSARWIPIRNRMVRTIKCHPHVSARRAGRSLLRRRRRCCSTSGSAARHASRRPPHETDQSAFQRQHRSAAQRYKKPPIANEVLNLRQARIADATGDVIGFRRCSKAGRLCSFLEGHGRPPLR